MTPRASRSRPIDQHWTTKDRTSGISLGSNVGNVEDEEVVAPGIEFVDSHGVFLTRMPIAGTASDLSQERQDVGHYLGYRIRLHRYPLDSGVAAKPPLLAHRKLARMQHDVGDRFIK
ncbi:MAG: hypothetical protein RIR87_1696 [Actinomycetota bacterium]